LADDEKAWLARRLEGEEQTRLRHGRHSVGEALKDRRVLTFGLLYFCMVVNVYGLSFWVGEIVGNISGLSEVGKGFVTAIPYAVAIVGLVVISRHSDRTGDRKRHVSACLAVAAVAFVLSTVVSPVAGIAALAVGLFFLLGAHPVFWTMPAALLSGTAAAAGIALINSIGNLGGFVGPYLVGLVKDATGSTDGGLIALAGLLLLGSLLATRVAHDPALERDPAPREARFSRERAPDLTPDRRTASSSRSPS
jgi:predicted MFS family arabinose efflux permease